MEEVWFKEVADELARCLVDARECAGVCEAFLDEVRARGDDGLQRLAVDAVLTPAAVAGVLIELIDHPPHLALAAARLMRETSETSLARLEELELDTSAPAAALAQLVASTTRLLEAAGEPA